MEVSAKRAGQRYDLVDIARFLCAFWVMLFHYVYTYATVQNGLEAPAALTGIARYGYMGVDFFFIISGFVIAYSSVGKTAMQFFESRFFRIWPTFVICMTASALVLHLSGARSVSLVEYLVNLTVVPAYLGVKPIDGVYWTLAYEIFFYAIVFVFVLFRAQNFQSHIMIYGSLLLLALSPFMLNETSYLALFVIGIAFQALTDTQRRRLVPITAIAGMGALAVAGAYVRAINLGFDGMTGAVILAILIGVFGILVLADRAQVRIGWARAAGLITYPLYLLHSKIGETAFDALALQNIWPMVLILVVAVMIAASYAVSIFDQKYIQGPVRKMYRKWANFQNWNEKIVR